MATTRKPCARCGKPLTKGRVAQGKRKCLACERLTKREAKVKAHETRVVAVYGLRPGEYDRLYEAQGGRCAVKGCRATGKTKLLAVEHDHRIGNTREAVRGLMCSRHNSWIGQAGDSPEVFESIAEYLRHPPAFTVLGTNQPTEGNNQHG